MSYRTEMLAAIDRYLAAPLAPRIRAALEAATLLPPKLVTGRDLVDLLRADPPWAGKDVALLTLVQVAQANARDWGAFQLLLAANQRAIDGLFRQRLRMRLDRSCGNAGWKDESWGTVQDAFQQAVLRYPVHRRPTTVASNLEGLTLKGLKHLAVAETKHSRAQKNFESLALPLMPAQPKREDGTSASLWEFARPRRQVSHAAAPDAAETQEALLRLDEFLRAEVIDEGDRRLLLGHFVEGRTLAELGRSFGLTAAAVNSRLQRAARRMRAYSAATPVRRKRRRRKLNGNRAMKIYPINSRQKGKNQYERE